MDYLNSIYDSIITSTSNIDDIINILKSIKGNVISIGSGGSRVVAEYVSLVLTTKNSLISVSVDPRDLNYVDKKNYENIFISSYSGSNFGVKYAINTGLKKYLLTTRKTNIKDEIVLHYDMESEHSFISIKATIIPMAIMLKYHVGDNFNQTIKEIFQSIDIDLNLKNIKNHINIFSGIDSKVCETFLESSLTESGIAIPLIHEKYSYCHGRSTINKRHDESAIFLSYNESELDESLIKVINLQMPNHCILKRKFLDPIINEFYLTLQCICLLKNIADSKKIDLSNIKYDKEAVKILYYFKGSM